MSQKLLRQIRLLPELVESVDEQATDYSLYVALTNNNNPVRIAISETETSQTASFINPDNLDTYNNPTLLIENSFEDIMSAKFCLDNYKNEQPSCMGATNEALININETDIDNIFPLQLKINDDIIVFPENTNISEFIEVLKTYGLELLPTVGEL